MPIPRFMDPKDGNTPVEPVRYCTKCGYAISLCDLTETWKQCRLCQNPLEDRLIRYPQVGAGKRPGIRSSK